MANNLVDCFAVSSEFEFFKIKKVVSKPILILDPIYENLTKLAQDGAVLTICNQESFYALLTEAKQNLNVLFKINIAVNTGMNRFGFSSLNEILKVFKICKKVQNISIFGVFSHYFEANNKIFANYQYNKFLKIKRCLQKNHLAKGVVFHIVNSDGVAFKNGFDMVRVGMNFYTDEFYQTITLKSKLIDVKFLNKGECAGYGGVFVASKKSTLGVVAIGYADGIFRCIYKNGYVLINGQFSKIVACCMDSILIDLTGIRFKIYDDVVLIGRSKNKQIFTCDMAGWCDTINYEIISRISSRVKRKYIFQENYANYYRKISCTKIKSGKFIVNKANSCQSERGNF